MTHVVVDASVAVKWFVPEALSIEARHLLAPEYELLAPDLLWAEVGNVLWKKHRRGEFDEGTATRILRDFSQVPVEFHPSSRLTEAALRHAIRIGITVYDGLYLALAAGNGCRMVTADRRLHEACHGGAMHRLVAWVGQVR